MAEASSQNSTSSPLSAEEAAAEARRNVFATVPFTRLLGVRREFSTGGRARLVVDEQPELHNVIKAVHGGVLLTLMDVVMASAAVSRVDFTMTAVTLSMSSCFLAPGRGRMTADGAVTGCDGKVAFCEAQVCDDAGEVVARAQGSFRYLPNP